MRTFKITLAYEGTGYVGWQRQSTGASVQALVEEALRAIDGREVAVAAAGRTDAGVHALGQAASFVLHKDLDADVLVRALNARLPPDVRALHAAPVRPGFHARFDAVAKTYRYHLCNAEVVSPFDRRYAWHVTAPLDVAVMDRAARILEGRHDFAAFRTAGDQTSSSERTLRSSAVTGSRRGAIVYEVTGDGFLRHMVRSVVGTLVEIGRGRGDASRMRDVLASRDRRQAGQTAPARGLFLVSVEYRDL